MPQDFSRQSRRSLDFKNRAGNRYWWFAWNNINYVPPVFAALSDEEWDTMDAWYTDTEVAYPYGTGECNIPAISFISGLIGGNNLKRVVQLGHYIGFSTLLMGFQLRSMGSDHKLISFDIDEPSSAYTAGWLERAGLQDNVKLVLSDSAAAHAPHTAQEYLGGPPELIFLDSSHQYQHTISELDTWFNSLAPGGMILMHDVSQYAAVFDASNKGGVLTALKEWSETRNRPHFAINESVTGAPGEPYYTYRDGCGLGIVQKPVS